MWKIRQIFEASQASREVFASLLDKFCHFGRGLYASQKEPEDFGSQENVLLNNYWPRVGDPEEKNPSHETHELKRGNPTGGPKDPANKAVCAAILNNQMRAKNAEYAGACASRFGGEGHLQGGVKLMSVGTGLSEGSTMASDF